MTTQTPDWHAMLTRLEKVEMQNRRLKLMEVVVLVLVSAALLMGQALPKSQIVEAESFIVRDMNGKPRAVLRVGPDGSTGLGLYDKDGKIRASLAMWPDGSPDLRLLDANGEVLFQAP